jgi:hypothetical protein
MRKTNSYRLNPALIAHIKRQGQGAYIEACVLAVHLSGLSTQVLGLSLQLEQKPIASIDELALTHKLSLAGEGAKFQIVPKTPPTDVEIEKVIRSIREIPADGDKDVITAVRSLLYKFGEGEPIVEF